MAPMASSPAVRGALIALAVMCVLGASETTMHRGEVAFIGAAHADDGDDDGDDGGGGGYGNSGGEARNHSGRRVSTPRIFRDIRRIFSPQRQARQRRQPAASPAFSQDEIVAVGLTTAQIDEIVEQGFQVGSRQPLSSLGGEVVKLVPQAGTNLASARDEIRQIAPAAAIDFNHYYYPGEARLCGGQPCVAPQMVGWPLAPNAASVCKLPDATVGLIDTSINADHVTFGQSRLEVHRLDPSSVDRSGQQHGTAVASLLVGTGPSGTPGLLPGARLIAVDAFKANDRADAYDLVRSLDILATRDVQVINLSLTGPDNAVLKQAIAWMAARRIEMVAAAGNDGPGSKPAFPAAYEEVVAVTAVDHGKRVYRRANRGDYIDLAAPGVGVWVAASKKGTRPKTGTSFAAPFVTAALVLARAQGHQGDVVQVLADTAEDLGEPGKDPVFGWGLLNASKICGAT